MSFLSTKDQNNRSIALVLIVCALIAIQSGAAWAGCASTNATFSICDNTSVTAVPDAGISSVTVDNQTTDGIFYSPTANSGIFNETLTLSGGTTVADGNDYGNNDGAGLTMQQIMNIVGDNVTLNSTAIIGSGVTINSNAHYGGAVYLRSESAGNVSIISAGNVTVTGLDSSNNPEVGAADALTAVTGLGNSSVINSGIVASNGRGLYAESNAQAVTLDGNGNVDGISGPAATASAANLAGGNVNATLAAMRVINYYGLSSAGNDGYLYSATRQAMVAWSDDGNTIISNSGNAESGDRNAVAAETEYGNVTAANSGTISASMAAQNTQSAGIGYSGIRADADFQGNVTITNTAAGRITANDDAAIVAHTPQGDATIINDGSLIGHDGIFATSGSGTGLVDMVNDTSAASAQIDGPVSISNGGSIQAAGYGAYVNAASGTITNTGTIASAFDGIGNAGTLTALTNKGTITGGSGGYGIVNTGSVGTLVNAQGGTAAAPLTYSGTLPGVYEIAITSKASYGQTRFSNVGSSSMKFAVATGSSLAPAIYRDVMGGVSATNLYNTAGVYDGSLWLLAYTGAYWNLELGPDLVDTIQALELNRDGVLKVLSSRAAAATDALDYDCASYDKDNVCLRVASRYGSFDGQSNGAGVIAGSYRLNPSLRFGAFVDYTGAESNVTGIKQEQDMPMLGGFVAYGLNPDGTGLRARLSGADYNGRAAITRDDSFDNTEPGNGTANLRAWAVGAELGWGYKFAPDTIATPYAGLRYIDATRDAYGEAGGGLVTFPISYNAVYQRQTTGSIGLRLNGTLANKLGYQLSVGLEYDLDSAANAYSGVSQIPGLTTFALANAASLNRLRGFGVMDLCYALTPASKLTSNVSVRGEAYTSRPDASVSIGYEKGF